MTERSDRLDRQNRLAKSWRGRFNMTHGATMGTRCQARAIAREAR
jgi:hypothetical protein